MIGHSGKKRPGSKQRKFEARMRRRPFPKQRISPKALGMPPEEIAKWIERKAREIRQRERFSQSKAWKLAADKILGTNFCKSWKQQKTGLTLEDHIRVWVKKHHPDYRF